MPINKCHVKVAHTCNEGEGLYYNSTGDPRWSNGKVYLQGCDNSYTEQGKVPGRKVAGT